MNKFKKFYRILLHHVNIEKIARLSIENMTWDRLAVIGHNPLARLVIVVPILGVFILFSDGLAEFLTAKKIDFGSEFPSWRVYFTYYSLFLISVGQVIYSLVCPNHIREHVTASNFINNEYVSTSTERVLLMLKDLFGGKQESLIDKPLSDILLPQIKIAQDKQQYANEEANSYKVLVSAWNAVLKDNAHHDSKGAAKAEYTKLIMKAWFTKDFEVFPKLGMLVFLFYAFGISIAGLTAILTFLFVLISAYNTVSLYVLLIIVYFAYRIYFAVFPRKKRVKESS